MQIPSRRAFLPRYGLLSILAVFFSFSLATTQDHVLAQTVTTTQTTSFVLNLHYGMHIPEVKKLQVFLNSNGFTIVSSGVGSPGFETNFFGPATFRAVKRYQAAHNIMQTGYVGPLTRVILNKTAPSSNVTPITPTTAATTSSRISFSSNLGIGSRSMEVKQLQAFLNSHGYTIASSGAGSSGFETNFFGPATLRAVKKYQVDHNIIQTGYVNSPTRTALNKESERERSSSVVESTQTPSTPSSGGGSVSLGGSGNSGSGSSAVSSAPSSNLAPSVAPPVSASQPPVSTPAPIATNGSGGAPLYSTPAPSSAYRNAQKYLFQPINQAQYISTLKGGWNYNADRWGPSYNYIDGYTGWNWTNPGGDWLDANQVAQGPTPWASFAANSVTGETATFRYTGIDVTALLQYCFNNDHWAAFILRSDSVNNGARGVAGLFNTAQVPPVITVTYTDGSAGTLAARIVAANTGSSSLPMTVQSNIYLPAFVEFERPTKAVKSASLSITVTAHWSGNGTINVFLLNPPLNAEPMTGGSGLASLAGPLDAGISSVANVFGAQRYLDGSKTLDFFADPSIPTNFNDEIWYDPALWGGKSDLTKFPHNVVNKWVLSAGSPTFVGSNYAGEGFAPLAPGLGAIKTTMPKNAVYGAEGGYDGGTGISARMFLPYNDMGVTNDIFIRYYMRLGTPYARTPADYIEVLQSGSPTWATMGGKFGITPTHCTTYGCNSGSSGGPYGWQMRYAWDDVEVNKGGPLEGGLIPGWHLYDFLSSNPAGYRYGGESQLKNNWGQKGGLGGVLYAGRWYEIESEVKLNTVHPADNSYLADGALRTWVDNRLVYERTGMVFRTLPIYNPGRATDAIRPMRELGVKDLWWNWYNGGTLPNTVDRTMFTTGLVWAKQRIGPMKLSDSSVVSPAPIQTPVPTVSLTANQTSIAYNATSQLSWSSTDATTCTTPGGSAAVSGNYTTPSLTANTTYTVTCAGAGGSVSTSLTVFVAAAPPPIVVSPPPLASPPLTNSSRPWAAAIPYNTWTQLPNTQFYSWARNGGIPPGAYLGGDNYAAIIDAFSDPANDPANGAQYFMGGGHGDGTFNGVIKFDLSTLTWKLVGQPTPPSKYPPDYANSLGLHLGAPVYPSGTLGNGWFLPTSQLSNPVDAAYATPLARMSTHMYQGAAIRGTKIYYFYGTYGEFDTATGLWGGQGVDLGKQLITFRPQYNSSVLQQGTAAVYDSVTDRFFVTLVPGDGGGGWRSGIIVFNPNTHLIENIYESNSSTYGLLLNGLTPVVVGRNIYYFLSTGNYNYSSPQDTNFGFIFNMDTYTMKKFVVTGDIAGTIFPNDGSSQDAVPSWYDGKAIRRWNYGIATRSTIYSVNLTPVRGTGTPADPYVLTQTSQTLAGTPPADVRWVFSRFMWDPASGTAVVIPESSSNFFAIRLQ